MALIREHEGVAVSANPARPDEVVGEARVADAAAVDAAVGRARAAQAAWRELGVIARGRVLRDCAAAIQRRADELATLMTAEEGKTIGEARVEVDLTA